MTVKNGPRGPIMAQILDWGSSYGSKKGPILPKVETTIVSSTEVCVKNNEYYNNILNIILSILWQNFVLLNVIHNIYIILLNKLQWMRNEKSSQAIHKIRGCTSYKIDLIALIHTIQALE